jgi:hypothetical protein
MTAAGLYAIALSTTALVWLTVSECIGRRK